MATSQRPKSASTNRRGVAADEVAGVIERNLMDLGRAPLAKRSREAYGQHFGAYGAWLTPRPEAGWLCASRGRAITRPGTGERHARAGTRGGNDHVLVAELAGHPRLETTRRYSLQAADRQAAMDSLEIEP